MIMMKESAATTVCRAYSLNLTAALANGVLSRATDSDDFLARCDFVFYSVDLENMI